MPPKTWKWIRGFLALMLGTLLVLLTDWVLKMGVQDSPSHPTALEKPSPQDGESREKPYYGRDEVVWGSPAFSDPSGIRPTSLRPY